MIYKEVTTEEFNDACNGMDDSYIDQKEFDELIDEDNSLVVIDLRSDFTPDKKYKNHFNITMEEMVSELLEKLIPVKTVLIVLVCTQSYSMTRMVPLTHYAYPTLKILGYDSILILDVLGGR
ncbi:hypothetical protein MNBD_GAMMA12-842 [hydrothermal vent metagenome]|uniref:Rhodanese domain-containing protein n=1 Tax=hydrothermal vent metagenome TaxID=652676 RepID=A0A3B0ZHA8_9ZZZZ